MASDGAQGDQLGYAIDLDGDTVVVGAPFDGIGANGTQGSAYTFASTGAALRNQTAKLTASDGGPGENFGGAVAIQGATIVVGAFHDYIGVANGDQIGSAYTFARTGGDRTETAKLTDPDGARFDQFGVSVDTDGGTIVAGAWNDDVGAEGNQGSAEVFFTAAAPARYPLSLTVTGDGDGQVTATGINCPGDCSETYDDGTLVTLTATAAAGSSFTSWTGDCAGAQSTCQVTMSQARLVTAEFTFDGPDLDGDGVRGSADQCPVDTGTARSNGCPLFAPPGPSCATTIVGSEADDTLIGSAYGNRFEGVGGDDDLQGLGGGDCLLGGEDNDELLGGEGNDRGAGGTGRRRGRRRTRATIACAAARARTRSPATMATTA